MDTNVATNGKCLTDAEIVADILNDEIKDEEEGEEDSININDDKIDPLSNKEVKGAIDMLHRLSLYCDEDLKRQVEMVAKGLHSFVLSRKHQSTIDSFFLEEISLYFIISCTLIRLL